MARNFLAFFYEEFYKQYYYHSDHLGSASLISDYNGNEYQRIEYTPYGETWVEKTSNTGLEFLPYKFTVKELDEETGLYYYGARYLDPKYSMWISTDPALGEYIPQAPINDEAKKNNQNLPGMGGIFNHINSNLYHYAGNNPVRYVDPDGRKINSLTDQQWEQVKDVKDSLVENLNTIVMQIENANYDIDKVDSSIVAAAKKYLTSEFGSFPCDLSVLASTLKAVSKHIDGLSRSDFKYDDAEENTYAYTFPLFDNIYLCDLYFSASDNGKDTKEGTILHEVTHFFWGLATKDHTYNHLEMIELPDSSKLTNANNWEYFYEELMN